MRTGADGTPAMPSDELMQQAIRHHQAGALAQAEPLYRQILATQPDHADALPDCPSHTAEHAADGTSGSGAEARASQHRQAGATGLDQADGEQRVLAAERGLGLGEQLLLVHLHRLGASSRRIGRPQHG